MEAGNVSLMKRKTLVLRDNCQPADGQGMANLAPARCIRDGSGTVAATLPEA